MGEASPASLPSAIAVAACKRRARAHVIGRERVPPNSGAYDFSECSEAAAEHAVYLADRCAATLDFLTVIEDAEDPLSYRFVPSDPSAKEPADPYRRTESGRTLRALVDRYSARLPTVICGRLEFGDPAKAILRDAETDHYDLIVMGTHGRHGLAHVLAGSVADAVVRHAPCPVLLVRPPR